MAMNPPERIHLIFKTHLDLGFTDLAEKVIAQYFTSYIPNALQLAKQLREQGASERFIWTTGSWLIYEYLEQASSQERRIMEEAISAGDLNWHGLPFTTHSELMDASLFTYGLSLSHKLDARFGKKTLAAKMTDVPGHTRGIVPLLAEAGILFLHIGVNPGSAAPNVPPVFVWKDSSGAEVIVIYQTDAYGGFTSIPGSSSALAFAHTNDNLGPQSLPEVLAVYQNLHTRFPQAVITASTLDAFVEELLPVKDLFPVITSEIGDTWIHGVGTDPSKVSQFRELSRLRRQWLKDGRLKEGERRTDAFSKALLQIAEHTWGLDEKTHLDNYTSYTPAQLKKLRETKSTRYFESSWREQRNYLSQALTALEQSPEAEEARTRLREIAPQPVERANWQEVQDWSQRFETDHFTLGFDPHSGALNYLKQHTTGHQWAAEEHVLGLIHYEIFSQSDYDRFWEQYVIVKEETRDWAYKDFNKPGIDQYIDAHKSWSPQLTALYQRRDEKGVSFLLEMSMSEQSVALGAPRFLTMELSASRSESALSLNLQWSAKQANRLPEALWCSFRPLISDAHGWSFSKLGTQITPLNVVSRGNRALHAVDQKIIYEGLEGKGIIETLDAPLIAPGKPSLLDFTDEQPDMFSGIHCNLYNNVWGTNFPMWYEEDARFRFILRFL